MKKISAVFDGLKLSDSTMQYAISITEKSKALLSGVFMESFLYHSFKSFDMVGRHGISATKLKNLLDEDKDTRGESAEVFKKACEKHHINYTIHHADNFALPSLLKESIYSDLLIINAGETMNHFEENVPTAFVRDVLAETQCPVLVVPEVYEEIKRLVLFYDGGPSSVFAIKMLNYTMPWMRNLETEVVFITADQKADDIPDDALIREFITCHYPHAKYTILKGDAEVEIPAYLKSASNTLAVLGAYQRGAVSRMFKTSMADILMTQVGVPLFIAHNQ